jgi:hypothetical protein
VKFKNKKYIVVVSLGVLVRVLDLINKPSKIPIAMILTNKVVTTNIIMHFREHLKEYEYNYCQLRK